MSLFQDVSRRWLEKPTNTQPRSQAHHIMVSAANLPAVKRLLAYEHRPPAADNTNPVPAAHAA